MGNVSRIRKSLSPGIAMADAHLIINGCKVFLGHPDSGKALSVAKGFKGMFIRVIERSRCPNFYDIYNSSILVREKLEAGEAISSVLEN